MGCQALVPDDFMDDARKMIAIYITWKQDFVWRSMFDIKKFLHSQNELIPMNDWRFHLRNRWRFFFQQMIIQ